MFFQTQGFYGYMESCQKLLGHYHAVVDGMYTIANAININASRQVIALHADAVLANFGQYLLRVNYRTQHIYHLQGIYGTLLGRKLNVSVVVKGVWLVAERTYIGSHFVNANRTACYRISYG